MSTTHRSMSVLHAWVIPVLLVSSQSYCSCLRSHGYLPSYSCHCGKYPSPSRFIGLSLSWACLQIHLVQPYRCIVKISSAEHLQATSFLVRWKWAQIILLFRSLHSKYCKVFSLQYWQLPAWPSHVLLESCCKGNSLSCQFSHPTPVSPSSMDDLFFTLVLAFSFTFKLSYALPTWFRKSKA